MHDELIDYLRTNTLMGRHARGEVLLFLERLEADGYSIIQADAPVDPSQDLSTVMGNIMPAANPFFMKMVATEEESASHD